MPEYENLNVKSGKYVIPAQRPTINSGASSWCSALTASLQSNDTFVPQGRSGLVSAKANVSASYIRKADWILQALGEDLQAHFRRNGVQVKLAKTMDEIFPDLRNRNDLVSNPAHERSWRQIRGYARGTVVGMPEYIQDPKTGKLIPQTLPSQGLSVQRHELGHILHNTSPLLYDENGVNDEFFEAYTEDLNKMTYSQCKRFRYLIQTKDLSKLSAEGMKEAFAEIFAAIFGGGCRDGEAVMAAFPNTTRYIHNAVRARFPDSGNLVQGAVRTLIARLPK